MPVLETRTQLWPDEAACQRHAEALASCWLALSPAARDAAPDRRHGVGAVIELHGTLGVGKTTWVRHLLRALGVQGTIKSPSYTVLESYDTAGGTVAHFDFYRFRDPQEWEDAGFREVYAGAGLKLAEWPEKAQGLLPVPDLVMRLECPNPTAPGELDAATTVRQLTLQAFTPTGLQLLP